MSKTVLSINNLHKSFDGIEILKGIDVKFELGTVTTIIGPSGSGKSTLLRCINQLESLTSGNIYFNGTDITSSDVNIENVRSSIGMVFQSFNLFNNLTVIENCMIGPTKVLKKSKQEAYDEASKHLASVGMLEYKDRKVNALSGGQKQRVAIARTLAMNPKVILFDEPTSSLDPEMVKEVLEVIKNVITPKISFIIVTHEMEFAAEVSDRIIFMDEGLIIESNLPTEIFNNPTNERLKKFIAK